MLMELLETLRKWETHVMSCKHCERFDKAVGPTQYAPCGIGRAIILNILHVLEKGL